MVLMWDRHTDKVLADVRAERARQHARYGSNADLEDGTGPTTHWLNGIGPYGDLMPSLTLETLFRQDYERHEAQTGKPTWMHLVREEVAEAFAEEDPERLREELVQVAALAVSWVEKLDARAEDAQTQQMVLDAVDEYLDDQAELASEDFWTGRAK